jgi:hypothetical protein
MRQFFSYAVLGLTLIASPVFAKTTIAGSMRFDVSMPHLPEDAIDDLSLSRARVDVKGDLTENVTFRVRLDQASSTSPVVKIPLVKVTWLYSPTMTFNFGIDTPAYDQSGTDNQVYITRSVGVLEDSLGNKLGVNLKGVPNNRFAYSTGVWLATTNPRIIDTSFSKIPSEESEEEIDYNLIDNVTNNSGTIAIDTGRQEMRFGFGGRMNYVLANNDAWMWGVGTGYQFLDVIKPSVIQYDSGSDVYFTTFQKRLALTADSSIGTNRVILNSAVHYFNYMIDNEHSSTNYTASNIFQNKNYARSGYVEVCTLVLGQGYGIDAQSGVISQIKLDPNQGALELALRLGSEHYYNFAAANMIQGAFNGNAAVPFTRTSTDGYNLYSMNPAFNNEYYEVTYSGYTVHAGYYPVKNILFKAEYYSTKTDSLDVSTQVWTRLETEEGIKFRSEFSF